jgi:hypothetical protein
VYVCEINEQGSLHRYFSFFIARSCSDLLVRPHAQFLSPLCPLLPTSASHPSVTILFTSPFERPACVLFTLRHIYTSALLVRSLGGGLTPPFRNVLDYIKSVGEGVSVNPLTANSKFIFSTLSFLLQTICVLVLYRPVDCSSEYKYHNWKR